MTMNMRPGTGMVLAATILWGTSGPAQVLAGSDASPVAIGGARLLVGGALLYLMSLRTGSALGVLRRSPLPLLAAAAATGIFQAAFFSSVERTGAALATAVALGVAPVATGIFDRLTYGSTLGRGWAAGTACAVSGCALLLLPGGSSDADLIGLLLGVVAGTCYGVYTVSAKQLADAGADMVAAVALTLLVGGVLFTPWVFSDAAELAAPASLMLVAWLAVASTVIGYLLFVYGLRRVSAATAGTLGLAEPLVAAFLGLGLLGEELTWAALGGCALLIGGLAAVGVDRKIPV